MSTANKNNQPQNDVPQQHAPEHSNMIKDPDNWTTGDETMTGAQQS